MAKIFMCYRRDDSGGYPGWIYEHLSKRFGKSRIFRDIDNIPPGTDFVEVVQKTLARSAAVVVLIGRNWLSGDNRYRLHTADDRVRQEIAQALNSKASVYPVLVHGAKMPAEHELPHDIRALARKHAIEIRDVSFKADFDQLARSLELLEGLKPAKSAGSGSTRSKKPTPGTQTRSGGTAAGTRSRNTPRASGPPVVAAAPGMKEPGNADKAGSGARKRRGPTTDQPKQRKDSAPRSAAKTPVKTTKTGSGSAAAKSAQAPPKKRGRKSAGASGGTGGGGARAPKGASKSGAGGARKTAARRGQRGGRGR